jgi:uncharacterized protein (TIGR02996 family)
MKNPPRKKLWYAVLVCNHRRWRKELSELLADHPETAPLMNEMYRGDDSARLVLADAAEENGHPYLARFLRTKLICAVKSPINRRKK